MYGDLIIRHGSLAARIPSIYRELNMQLLHIDSSISGAQSVSRQLSASAVARLKETSPDLTVVYRDLAAAPVPHQSPALLFAKLKTLHEVGALHGDMAAMVDAAVQGGARVEPTAQAGYAP